MQTDVIFAYRLDIDDFLVVEGEVAGQVKQVVDDEFDTIHVTVVTEDGEQNIVEYGPFETAVIVTSFEDPE